MDLRNWNFEKQGAVKLDGEWEFFWNELIIESSSMGYNKNYIGVPSLWNGYKLNGRKLEGFGYGSYRLKILLDDNTKEIALRLGSAGTSYSLFIDGKLLVEIGKVGKTEAEAKPFFIPIFEHITLNHSEVDVVIQVSNFSICDGGLWTAPIIGDVSSMKKNRDRTLALDLILSGALLIMGGYHLGLYSIRRKDISPLYFALFCFMLLARLLVSEERYIIYLFPTLNWEITFRIEYLSFYMASPVFAAFMYSLFPEDFNKKILYVITAVFAILSSIILLFNTKIFTLTLLYAQISTLLSGIYCIYVLGVCIYRKRIGSKTLLTGFVLFFGSVLNDILAANFVIHSVFLAPYGFLVFIFTQAFILSRRFASAFVMAENLAVELIQSNQELIEWKDRLEIRVEVRTSELNEEKEKADKLLRNILPEEVAEQLKQRGEVTPVLFENVTILFTDFEGFTQITEKLTPVELIKELDSCFVLFDNLADNYKLEKLKTIGDSYMCVGGIPIENKTNAVDTCLAAFEILAFMNQINKRKVLKGQSEWLLRIGIHTGPVIAGVVGTKKFAYDVWGDSVNIASRMEASGTANKINISSSTHELVNNFFISTYRGKINAKNKGDIDMYYLDRIRPELSKDENGFTPNSIFWERYNRL
jgi:class 3 adenylate cyclase